MVMADTAPTHDDYRTTFRTLVYLREESERKGIKWSLASCELFSIVTLRASALCDPEVDFDTRVGSFECLREGRS